MKDYLNSHIYIDGLSADAISRIDEGKKNIPKEIKIELTPRK